MQPNGTLERWRVAPDDRFARHRLIAGWDQALLRRSHVLVAGAGATGNEAIARLALMGVGRVTVIDADRIECSNLARTVLFRAGDVGRSKAAVAAERAAALAPEAAVRGIDGDIEHDLGAGLVASADVALGCVDNLGARVALNRLCHRAATPLIDCGIDLTAAQVTLVDPAEPDAGCLECALTGRQRERLAERRSCGEGLRRAAAARRVPTTATVAAIAGALQVQQAIAVIHGRAGSPVAEIPALAAGTRVTLSTALFECRRDRLSRSAQCTAHEGWTPDVRSRSGPEASLRDLATELAAHGHALRALRIDQALVTAFHCARCGREPWGRPAARTDAAQLRCRCGAERAIERTDAVELASPWASVPLRRIGVPDQAWLLLDTGGEALVCALRGEVSGSAGGARPADAAEKARARMARTAGPTTMEEGSL